MFKTIYVEFHDTQSPFVIKLYQSYLKLSNNGHTCKQKLYWSTYVLVCFCIFCYVSQLSIHNKSRKVSQEHTTYYKCLRNLNFEKQSGAYFSRAGLIIAVNVGQFY